MFAYFSDEYIQKNKEIYRTLSDNQNKYFTNDLSYELMCSIFNIKSNHFDETNIGIRTVPNPSKLGDRLLSGRVPWSEK